ncbi:hypothetical protein SO802_026557 [Lithocarpus litseifolius]|uniref:Reverse transcriptase zinc-binding domain-containing protein n=1 Tax=Lithocarpus litseifolius TaxID=425828 RepID=A0AAW2C0E1_9ROSI
MVEILQQYEAASGQQVNTDKSSVVFSHNIASSMKEEVMDILGPMQHTRHGKVCSPSRLFDDIPMVSSLIDEDTRHWKVDVVRSLFLPFEAQTILSIPLSYNLPEDTIGWIGNHRGVFSAKSAYFVALALVDPSVAAESLVGDYRTPLWKKMWQLKITAKIRVFAWRAYMNGLPTQLTWKTEGSELKAHAHYVRRVRKASNMHWFIVVRHGRFGGVGRPVQ